MKVSRLLMLCLCFTFAFMAKIQAEEVSKNLSVGENVILKFGKVKVDLTNQGPAVTLVITGGDVAGFANKNLPFLKVDGAKKTWIFSFAKGRLDPNVWQKLPKGWNLQIDTAMGTLRTSKFYKGDDVLLMCKVDQKKITVFLGRGKLHFSYKGGKFSVERGDIGQSQDQAILVSERKVLAKVPVKSTINKAVKKNPVQSTPKAKKEKMAKLMAKIVALEAELARKEEASKVNPKTIAKNKEDLDFLLDTFAPSDGSSLDGRNKFKGQQ